MTINSISWKSFLNIRKKNPDCMILVHDGNSYWTFMEQAETLNAGFGCAKRIDYSTHNPEGKPLVKAGFPEDDLTFFLPKIVKSGMRVAIFDLDYYNKG